jgi:hypothetical protein
MYYNFARVHQTLRVMMEAGIADHVWSIEEIVALARECGFESWAALKRDREQQTPTVFASPEERVTAFIEHACVHYGVNPRTRKWEPTGYVDAPERWE